jgi:NAD(P)-dependent dehydrogenase (short-subunit alcohol dehydrogenase family)
MSTSNRVGIVTGASRGLGAVIAQVLVDRGYDLVVGARTPDLLEQVAKRLARHGARIIPVAGDVTDAAVRARLVDAARADSEASTSSSTRRNWRRRPLMDFDVYAFRGVFPVNAGAPVALIQRAVPLLEERRGLVVNVTSDAARGAYVGWGPYGASKAALELLTRTLAAELQGRAVSAVIVDPGDMRTRMHQDAFPGEDISDRPLPEVTVPFWHWLFDQAPSDVSGERFEAQAKDARWLLHA